MHELLDQLLGLRRLGTGDTDVRLEFAHQVPLWAWVFIALACAAAASWGYWRLLGSRPGRVTLGVVRAVLLVLVVALLAGPQLVRQTERTERDWLIVMADRSASMMIADVARADGAARATREEQLTSAVRAAWPAFADLAKDRNLMFLGFDSGAYDLRLIDSGGPIPGGVALGEPLGRRTAIGKALDQVLRRVAARPVAGIVLLSDGRSSDTPPRTLLRQLEARQIPVFTVPLGSPTPIPDLAVGRIDAPPAAFINDIVPVTVEVERRGLAPDAPAPTGRVELVDKATGAVLDTRPLPADHAEASPITLTAHPTEAGAASWAVRIVPDTPDLSDENNHADLRIDLVGRPMRVVYFDGYPRWEYRYLKNLLLREKSIRSSSLLLAVDRRYIQEGTDPLDVLPRTPAAWAPFDVVVLGDLRPDLFSDEQLRQIKDLVSQRGAGLLWVGGPGATPTAWRGTPLADLLPFSFAADSGSVAGAAQPWPRNVVMAPAPAAQRLGVLRLGDSEASPWPEALSDPSLGWPLLRWAQRIDAATLKPTAEPLALAAPVSGDGATADLAAAAPLVVTMRYGAGRIIYVGTDETWRYRYGRGEAVTERFWIPLIRLLGRESLGRSGRPATLEAAPQQAQVDQPVQITVRLLDESLIERRPPSITVRVTPTGVAPGAPSRALEIELKPEAPQSDDAISAPGAVSRFTAPFVPAEPGDYRVDSQDPTLSGLDLSATVHVALPDDEMRTPQTDHALLASLSSATGGEVLTPAQLSRLANLLPNRQVRVLGTPETETLWDKPIVWALLIVLLAAEWIGRRLVRLP